MVNGSLEYVFICNTEKEEEEEPKTNEFSRYMVWLYVCIEPKYAFLQIKKTKNLNPLFI